MAPSRPVCGCEDDGQSLETVTCNQCGRDAKRCPTCRECIEPCGCGSCAEGGTIITEDEE